MEMQGYICEFQILKNNLAKNMAIMKLLMKYGADGDKLNYEGLAPVHIACLNEEYDALQYMIHQNRHSTKILFNFNLQGKI